MENTENCCTEYSVFRNCGTKPKIRYSHTGNSVSKFNTDVEEENTEYPSLMDINLYSSISSIY